MKKSELVEKVAKSCGLSKASADDAVNTVMGAIADALASGDKVTLVGFGTFAVAERAAREGRNPKTGEKMNIPASKGVKFKAGSRLTEGLK